VDGSAGTNGACQPDSFCLVLHHLSRDWFWEGMPVDTAAPFVAQMVNSGGGVAYCSVVWPGSPLSCQPLLVSTPIMIYPHHQHVAHTQPFVDVISIKVLAGGTSVTGRKPSSGFVPSLSALFRPVYFFYVFRPFSRPCLPFPSVTLSSSSLEGLMVGHAEVCQALTIRIIATCCSQASEHCA